jgi:hypothetical protein
MSPVSADPLAVMVFHAAIIRVMLWDRLMRCPDPGIVAVLIPLPLSVPLRLVMFTMPVVFFMRAIAW